VKRRIQGTGLDLEQIFRRPLNVFGDCVAVSGAGQQGAEDEKVEGTLEKFDARGLAGHCVGILLFIV
jgi:hypothetical protein